MEESNKKNGFELLVITILIALSTFFLFQTQGEFRTDQSGLTTVFLPKIVFISILFLCAILLIKQITTFLKKGKERKELLKGYIPTIPLKISIAILLIVGYIFIWSRIGFILSSIIFALSFSFLLSDSKSYLKHIIISILFPVGIYLLFDGLFQINLPSLPF